MIVQIMIVWVRVSCILYDSKLSMRNKTAVSLEFLFWCTDVVTIASANVDRERGKC